jgi:hypothetical protein
MMWRMFFSLGSSRTTGALCGRGVPAGTPSHPPPKTQIALAKRTRPSARNAVAVVSAVAPVPRRVELTEHRGDGDQEHRRFDDADAARREHATIGLLEGEENVEADDQHEKAERQDRSERPRRAEAKQEEARDEGERAGDDPPSRELAVVDVLDDERRPAPFLDRPID